MAGLQRDTVKHRVVTSKIWRPRELLAEAELRASIVRIMEAPEVTALSSIKPCKTKERCSLTRLAVSMVVTTDGFTTTGI